MSPHGESLSKDLTPEQFGRFRDYIHEHSGIFLEEQKIDSLRISLVTRATRHECESLQDYFDLLRKDEDEFKELMNLITINETSFFRFPQQFESLRANVIPEILESRSISSRNFRVWSAGCSTGEEPYSIAMTLMDSGIEGFGYSSEVLGTDVSTNALLRARQAVYPARSISNLPRSTVTRFFEPTSQGHRVVERVRKLTTFQYHNLIKEPYPAVLMGNWDVIFCRNVTIYFQLESTRRVVRNFFNGLNPGGYLFIGHSETLTSISDDFEPVEVGGVFLYRKPPATRYFGVQGLPGSPGRARAGRRDAVRSGARPHNAASRAVSGSRTAQDRSSRAEAPEIPLASETTAAAGSAEEILTSLEAARAASTEGRPDAVLQATKRVLQLDPQCTEAYLLSAFAHADSGDLDAAFDECNRVVAIDPLLASARYVLGIIHLRRNERSKAIAEFKRTIYVDPGFAMAHLNLANLHKVAGAYADAARDYENALRALYENPEGPWRVFMGGFQPDLLARTVERSLVECRRSLGGS